VPTRRTSHERQAPAQKPSVDSPPALAIGDRLGSFFSQNKILGGAAEVFRRKGIDAATVEDILVAAGVSRRTFYKAFANKDEVLVALHRELTALFLSAMRAAVASATTPEERVARCVDVYLLAAQRSGGLMLVLQAEALRPGRLSESRRAALAGVAKLMEESAVAMGREVPDPLLITALLTGLEAVVRTLMEEGRLGDADIARARRVMMRLALAALAEEGDSVPALPRAQAKTS
jgi:AcrR family transcriptional regulator